VKLKPERNSGLNGIRTHDLCDTGAGLLNMYNNFFPCTIYDNGSLGESSRDSYTKAWPKPLVSVSFKGAQSERGIKVKIVHHHL